MTGEGLTAMTFTYKTRCEGGMNPKLMACAGIHNFHPVVTVGKSFSCKSASQNWQNASRDKAHIKASSWFLTLGLV